MDEENTTGVKIARGLNFRWSDEVRAKAFAIYLVQENPDVVAISEELGVPVATLRHWQKRDKWVEKKKSAFSIVMEQTFQSAIAEINSRRRKALENIDIAIETAVIGVNDPDLEFRDKKQAADVLRDFTKLLNELFDAEEPKVVLTEVGEIILEEVSSDAERQRIAERLLEIERSWRK